MHHPSSVRHRLACLVVLIVIAAAPAAAAEDPPSTGGASPPATPTIAEGDRWGEEFATALAASDVEAASRMIDWDTVFATATSGTTAPEPWRARFVAEGTRRVSRSGFVAHLAKAAAAGGSVAPLRCHLDGGECHVLLRVIQDTGLNYLDVRLMGHGAKTRAADAYVFLAGENLSATIGKVYQIATAGMAAQGASQPAGPDTDSARRADVLQRFMAATDAGDHEQVLDITANCPADLLTEKPILMARAIAAVRAGDDRHAQALDDLRAAFPDDACVDLVAIDHHARAQDRAACLAAIDRLDERLGGDPYLDVLRATVHVGAADYAEAIRASEAAVAALPRLPQPCWIRLAISLEQKRHDDTAAWLDRIAERFGVAFPDLEAIPEYAAFVQSPEYRAWKARRR